MFCLSVYFSAEYIVTASIHKCRLSLLMCRVHLGLQPKCMFNLYCGRAAHYIQIFFPISPNLELNID